MPTPRAAAAACAASSPSSRRVRSSIEPPSSKTLISETPGRASDGGGAAWVGREHGRTLLDVVVRERAAVLQLLAREDQALLVGRDALLVLDLRLDVLDRVRGLDLQGDRLAWLGLRLGLGLGLGPSQGDRLAWRGWAARWAAAGEAAVEARCGHSEGSENTTRDSLDLWRVVVGGGRRTSARARAGAARGTPWEEAWGRREGGRTPVRVLTKICMAEARARTDLRGEEWATRWRRAGGGGRVGEHGDLPAPARTVL